MDAWNWYVSEDAKNLWECAKENGYISSSVGFPVSVGAKSDYHIPEIWRDGSHLDSKLIDAVSRPQGMVREMEKEIGRFAGGTDLTIEGDTIRQKAALWILDNKIKKHLEEKPFLMSCYYAAYDETAHINEVYNKEAIEDLEKTGQIVKGRNSMLPDFRKCLSASGKNGFLQSGNLFFQGGSFFFQCMDRGLQGRF